MWSTQGYLLSGTGVSANHMPYYEDNGACYGYFSSRPNVLAMVNMRIVRPDSTTKSAWAPAAITVDASYELCTRCDMVAFQNQDIGARWFYGFVTSLEYVNETTTRVHFDIDWFHTYCGDLTIGDCFVEREHIENDWDSVNTVSEPISPSTSVYYATAPNSLDIDSLNSALSGQKDLTWCVMATSQPVQGNDSPLSGRWIGGTYVPLHVLTATSQDGVQAIVNQYASVGKVSAIVCIVGVPSEVLGASNYARNVTIPYPSRGMTIGSYAPLNRKCFTYPYCGIAVSSLQGDEMIFRWEADNGGALDLIVYGVGGIAPAYSVSCPRTGETTSFTGFPQLAWTGDVASNYFAANKFSIAGRVIGGGALTAIGVATGNPLVAASGAYSVANTVTSIADKNNAPNEFNGQAPDMLALVMQRLGLQAFIKSTTSDDIESIDNFFSYCGYATNRTKRPNLNTRPLWNYVKANNAQVTGACPHEAIEFTQNMLTSGVTLWQTQKGAVVGQYDLEGNIG